MDCPVCGERLREIERSGVMIDICPSCKGIWLDRGKIDKLIEAEGRPGGSASARGPRTDDRHDDRGDHDEHRDDRGDHEDQRGGGQCGSGKGKRRGSFFEDILGGFGGD